MTIRILSRRSAVHALAFGAFAGTGLVAFGQEFDRARNLVARVQDDLQRAEEFTRNNEKERVRYENAQRRLSEFDRQLSRDNFDKGKLDDVINDMKDIVQKNTLEGHERDELARDLADLRTLRDIR